MLSPAIIGKALFEGRKRLNAVSNVDVSVCSNWASLLSAGSKNGDKITLMGLSKGFGAGAWMFDDGARDMSPRIKKKILYGDAAFEFYKIVGGRFRTNGGKGKYSFKAERIVCAARFDVQIKLCNTCCCKKGIVANEVSSAEMKPGGYYDGMPGCKQLCCKQKGKRCCGAACVCDNPAMHNHPNKRLCNTPVSGWVQGDNGMLKNGKLPVKLGDLPKEGQYPGCSQWFTLLDAVVRYAASSSTSIVANSFHGPSRKSTCQRSGNFCATGATSASKLVLGGTNCLAAGRL